MKKKNGILMALLAASLAPLGLASADDDNLMKSEVPKPVLKAFQKAHPKARKVEYEATGFKGKLAYEIEFTENGKKYEALYSPDGALLRRKLDDDKE